jgi:hypothetical protein
MKVSAIGGISPPKIVRAAAMGDFLGLEGPARCLGDLRWFSNRELRRLHCIAIKTTARCAANGRRSGGTRECKEIATKARVREG